MEIKWHTNVDAGEHLMAGNLEPKRQYWIVKMKEEKMAFLFKAILCEIDQWRECVPRVCVIDACFVTCFSCVV